MKDKRHYEGYHWARTTSNSFNLGVLNSLDDSNSPNEWEAHWNGVLMAWSESEKIELVSLPGENGLASRQSCDAERGYVRVCNGDYGSTPWSGRAEWSFYITEDSDEGHIFECAIRVNDDEIYAGDSEQKILCHEIGHCLGLGHTSEDPDVVTGSCMDYSSSLSSYGPGSQDLSVLRQVYNHADDTNTFELVEPQRNEPEPPAPIDSPTPSPIRSTPAPVRPTPSPVRPTPSPVRSTQAPVRQVPAVSLEVQSPTIAPVTPAPINLSSNTGGQCGRFTDKKDCKKVDGCTWNKSAKTCTSEEGDDAVVNQQIQDPSDDGVYCGAFSDKSTCKSNKSCKWKKDVCTDEGRRRRVEEDECNYDPLEFDVLPDAVAIDCDEFSVLFERRDGNKATRINVIFSSHFRRNRRLRGLSK